MNKYQEPENPIELTNEMIEVCAKAFFEDCQNDKDYPHKSWEGQYEEFKRLLDRDEISPAFLDFCYQTNKKSFN